MVIWEGYYTSFEINPDSVREGCEPQIMVQNQPTEKAIILIHGLTDSPYFMKAIGECFYQWGFNVFIPLLDGHGLKNPKYLKDVTMEAWIKNVDFAIQQAKDKYKCQSISIGGLSTGGTLSVLKMFDSPNDITGGLFLFSAALDIAGKTGNLKEKLLRTYIVSEIFAQVEDLLDKDLIGDNPYRYSRMDNDGAKELSKLIGQIDKHLKNLKKDDLINKPIFVAHSEYDSAADIQGVEALIAKSHQDKTEFLRIGKYFHVPHASVVLKEDVLAKNGSPLEPKNPFFDEMMSAANKFQKQHLGKI